MYVSKQMGNIQDNGGYEDNGGWCAAKREVKQNTGGQKPKLNFQRHARDNNKDKNNDDKSGGGGLCAAPRVACLDSGDGSRNGGFYSKNKAQMTEWEKRKDMLKQRIRNKLNNAKNPSNSVASNTFDGPCTCRGLCVCHYKKAAQISDSAKSASDAFDARLKKIKDQIKKEKQRERHRRASHKTNTFIDI